MDVTEEEPAAADDRSSEAARPSAPSPKPGNTRRSPARVAWSAARAPCLFLILLACVVLGQRPWAASPSDFGRHPDEAGHFISGTLVYDWLCDGCPRPVWDYGREYYARLPKVAVGHWPPLFYVAQAAWYGVFQVGNASVLWLVALIGAAFLSQLFRMLAKAAGTLAACLVLVIVLCSSLLHYSTSMLMGDLFLGVLCLMAILEYHEFLAASRLRNAIGFSLLASAALLSKPDAIALAAVPVLSVVFTRRWQLLRDWKFYLPAVIVGGTAGVYQFLFGARLTSDAFTTIAGPSVGQKLVFLCGGLSLAGAAGALAAVLGGLIIAAPRLRPERLGLWPAVLAAWTVGVFAIHLLTPVSLDPRYLIQLVPAAALLCAVFFDAVWRIGRAPAWGRMGALAAAVVLLVAGQGDWADRRVEGYRVILASLPQRDGLLSCLVASDSTGDGAVIAGVRLDPNRNNVCILRADKQLASADWMGGNYHLKADSVEDVERYILSQPVQYIIIDDWGVETGPHGRLLQKTIRGNSARYRLLEEREIVRQYGPNVIRRQARLYQVIDTASLDLKTLCVRLPDILGGRVTTVQSRSRRHKA
jgi:hypothetical protein